MAQAASRRAGSGRSLGVSRKRLKRQRCLPLCHFSLPTESKPAPDLVTDWTPPNPPSGRLPASTGSWLPLSHPDPSCHSQQALSATPPPCYVIALLYDCSQAAPNVLESQLSAVCAVRTLPQLGSPSAAPHGCKLPTIWEVQFTLAPLFPQP